MTDNSFFAELKKRRVIQVAAIYGVVAWGVTEIVVTIVEQLFLPTWFSTLAVIAFVVGFPIAMFLSWTFDITPEGIQRTTISSRKGKASIVGAVSLLILFTAALFVLIKPSGVERITPSVIPNSIAVLPFENTSGNSDDEYLVGGLSDELRDQLGRVSGIRIAARSSSIAAEQQSADVKSRSASLGVASLIEGSVRRRDNELRISVELVEGDSALVIWKAIYDSSPRELLAVQQNIAEEIVKLILPEAGSLARTQSTRSETANELMLLARFYEQQVREQREVDEQTLHKAIDHHRRAIEADPNSALAHARLADSLMYAGNFGAAEAPIFRALSIDPEISEVQNSLGRFYWARGDGGAGVAFRRAVEFNSNNADALSDYAYWLWLQGYAKESLPLYRRALELDPLSLARFGALGDYYAYSGLIPEALEIARRVEDNFQSAASFRLIARLMELTGRVDHSIAWTIRARNKEPKNAEHTQSLAELYAELGDFDTALALEPQPGVGLLFKMRRYQRLIEIGEFLMIDEPNDLELRYLLAYSYLVTRQAEAAVRVLRSTGLPDTVLGEARQASDIEAFITLIDALDAIGESALAIELSAWWQARPHSENDNWWILLYLACPRAVSGFDEEALDLLVRIADSPRLPWESLIKDMRCLQRFADEPRYQAMLESTENRRKQQLERLPTTLAEHGVSL